MTGILLKIAAAILITMFLFNPLLSASEDKQPTSSSIVPANQMISDFEARMALAKILSYNDDTLNESMGEYEMLFEQQPDNLEVRLDMAKIFIRKKMYQDALLHLNYVISKKPDDAEALSSIGDIQLYAGRLKEAVSFYNKVLEANPSSYEMQKKLALALSWDGNVEKALPLLLNIYTKNPENKEIAVELARIYARKMNQQKALSVLHALHKRYPDDHNILAEIAGIEVSLGHAVKCSNLYIEVLKKSNNDETVFLRYADAMNLWGDFYKIENIYKNYLRTHPGSKDITLKLAWLYVSSERYEEAEGIYRALLLDNPDMTEALLDMAKLRLLEKRFTDALSFTDKLLIKMPANFDVLSLKAESFAYLKKYDDALQTFREIINGSDKNEKRADALVNSGKVYLKQNDRKKALECFEKAYEIDRQSVKVKFYFAGAEKLTSRYFIDKILETESTSPGRLKEWAELYALQGLNDEAISFYRAALKNDPEFFPASMGLSQMYAIDHQYSKSIELLGMLDKNLPGTSKIMIWKARALAWSKEYEKSIEAYNRVRQFNYEDPVPKREKARVAVWGKMMDDADAFYKEMYTPQVDKDLLKAIAPDVKNIENDSFIKALEALRKTAGEDSVYKGYEKFSEDFESYKKALPDNQRIQIEKVLIELLPAYRIQKDALLENRSKSFAWHKKFVHALESYEELTDFSPGNQEAIFDYAQAECALGLCEREAKTYNTLLNIDPLHSLAGLALERQKIRKNFFLQFNYNYWMEDGRGELSRISRNRFDLTFNVPLSCQYYAGITGHRWLENPWYNHKTYAADGYSIFFGGTVNPFVKGEVKWTYKKYNDSEMSPRNTGHAFLWFNLKDYAHLGGGYEKTDEIYNYFDINQGTQSDSWWIGGRSDITRKLEINAKARFINYNDSNSGQHYQLSAGYAATDHPKIFKVTLSGEYRDTKKDNIFIYSGNTLINIIHPYWTPQNYTGTGIVFEWYHDYSKLFFCGNELKFYDIKVFFGTDSDNNPAAKIEAELHHQLHDHWTISIKGMLHSSPQWSANGLWATLKYQF